MLKYLKLLPWCVTLPVFCLAFASGAFFTGTDKVWFAPTAVGVVIIACFSLFPGLRQGWQVPRSVSYGAVALFWLYMFVAMCFSTAPYVSQLFFVVFSFSPLLFFSLTLSPQPEKAVRVYGTVLLACLTALAIWVVIQFLFKYQSRISHPYLNPNNLAAILNTGLIPVLALFLKSSRPRVRALLGILLAIFVCALLATQSRGATIALVISAAVLMGTIARPVRQHGKALLLVLVICGTVIGCMELYLEQSHGTSVSGTITSGIDVSRNDRVALWESTLKMTRDVPFFGTGLGTFYFYYTRYRSPTDYSDGYFAHMDPLQFWVEAGILAPLIFYGLLIAILLRTIRAVRATTPDSPERAQIMAPFAALLAVAGHTHISFHLYILSMHLPLGIWLAYWYIATEKVLAAGGQEERITIPPPAGRVRTVAALLGVVLAVYPVQWCIRAAAATYYIEKADEVLLGGDYKSTRNYVDTASLFAPASYFHIGQYEARWRIEKLWQHKATMPAPERKILYEQALRYLDRAISLNPAYTNIRNDRAKLYIIAHDIIDPDGLDKAQAELEQILAENPMYLEARMALADIYKKKGAFKKALQTLEVGLEWPRIRGQGEVDFLVAIARLYLLLGDEKKHNLFIREAAARAMQYGLMKPASR